MTGVQSRHADGCGDEGANQGDAPMGADNATQGIFLLGGCVAGGVMIHSRVGLRIVHIHNGFSFTVVKDLGCLSLSFHYTNTADFADFGGCGKFFWKYFRELTVVYPFCMKIFKKVSERERNRKEIPS